MGQTVPVTQTPQMLGRIDGHTNYASKTYVVGSGVTINAGDFVYLASGVATNASVNGARLLGMAEGPSVPLTGPTGAPVAGTSTGTVVVNVCIDPMMRYLIKSTTALAITNGTNADIGQYFEITGATGAQTVSLTGTTLGALVLLDVPGSATFPIDGIAIPSGTTVGMFQLVNSFLFPYVAS